MTVGRPALGITEIGIRARRAAQEGRSEEQGQQDREGIALHVEYLGPAQLS